MGGSRGYALSLGDCYWLFHRCFQGSLNCYPLLARLGPLEVSWRCPHRSIDPWHWISTQRQRANQTFPVIGQCFLKIAVLSGSRRPPRITLEFPQGEPQDLWRWNRRPAKTTYERRQRLYTGLQQLRVRTSCSARLSSSTVSTFTRVQRRIHFTTSYAVPFPSLLDSL